jgi:hypothetical protein
MSRSNFHRIWIPVLMILAMLIVGCEKTVDEGVVQPVKAMHAQKEAASLEAAVSNVRIVRGALMRYPALSSDNLYPSDTDISDYDSLREVLADEGLPGDMADLLWDSFYGIRYNSDGYTFTFQVKAAGNGKIITATPNGVQVGE